MRIERAEIPLNDWRGEVRANTSVSESLQPRTNTPGPIGSVVTRMPPGSESPEDHELRIDDYLAVWCLFDGTFLRLPSK